MDINFIFARFNIDGNYETYSIEKSVLDYNETEELYNIELKVTINDIEYVSNKKIAVMESAVIDLQKQLPKNIKIECCQSCKHGNFCPYGNADNEIFCFINYPLKTVNDVIDIFDVLVKTAHTKNEFWNWDYVALPHYDLLHWCDEYQKIVDADYYAYNAWIYSFNNDEML